MRSLKMLKVYVDRFKSDIYYEIELMGNIDIYDYPRARDLHQKILDYNPDYQKEFDIHKREWKQAVNEVWIERMDAKEYYND